MDPLLYDVPDELATERLRMRVPRAGDGAIVFPSVRASMTELNRWMPWAKPEYSESDAETWCRLAQANFHARKGVQALIFRGDQHVGNVGAFDLRFDVCSCEIGYWLRTDATGNGYMTEAVAALAGHVAKHLKMHRIQIKCDPRNGPSAAVARRCGFALDGTLRQDAHDREGKPRDTHVFSRLYDA